MIQNLPKELIDSVAGHLVADRQTLVQLMKVSKLFYLAVSPIVYAKLTLRVDWDTRDLEADRNLEALKTIKAILTRKDSPLRHIKHLDVHIRSQYKECAFRPRRLGQLEGRSCHSYCACRWLKSRTLFIEILDLLRGKSFQTVKYTITGNHVSSSLVSEGEGMSIVRTLNGIRCNMTNASLDWKDKSRTRFLETCICFLAEDRNYNHTNSSAHPRGCSCLYCFGSPKPRRMLSSAWMKLFDHAQNGQCAGSISFDVASGTDQIIPYEFPQSNPSLEALADGTTTSRTSLDVSRLSLTINCDLLFFQSWGALADAWVDMNDSRVLDSGCLYQDTTALPTTILPCLPIPTPNTAIKDAKPYFPVETLIINLPFAVEPQPERCYEDMSTTSLWESDWSELDYILASRYPSLSNVKINFFLAIHAPTRRGQLGEYLDSMPLRVALPPGPMEPLLPVTEAKGVKVELEATVGVIDHSPMWRDFGLMAWDTEWEAFEQAFQPLCRLRSMGRQQWVEGELLESPTPAVSSPQTLHIPGSNLVT